MNIGVNKKELKTNYESIKENCVISHKRKIRSIKTSKLHYSSSQNYVKDLGEDTSIYLHGIKWKNVYFTQQIICINLVNAWCLMLR